MKDLVVKKCDKCGVLVKVVKDGDAFIECCGASMKTLVPNSVDAAVEKHVPIVKHNGDIITVIINHVMESDHYIEWISYVSENYEEVIYFKPGDIAQTEFTYKPNSKVYAYCNKHELWVNDVK